MAVVFYGIPRGYRLSNLKWLVGQSWLESAYMKDEKALTYNNPFGMSRVHVRPTNQLGYVELSDGNTFGTYENISAAVRDRYEWDKYFDVSQSTYPKDVSKKYHGSAEYENSVSAVSVEAVGVAILVLFSLIPFSYWIMSLIKSTL